MNALFRINDHHPALEGHFPNNPVVPAALILEEISNVFFNLTDRLATTVKHVRFLSPLKPGQEVSINFCPDRNEGYRFSCISAEKIISKGIISSTPSVPINATPPQWSENCLTDTESIYQNLPHTGEMRLLDAVIHQESDTFIAIAQSGHSPLNNEDTLLGWPSFEYAAQALACRGVIHHIPSESSPPLFQKTIITRLKSMHCYHARSALIQAPLITSIKLIESLSNAARCEFRIFYGENIISEGLFDVAFQKA